MNKIEYISYPKVNAVPMDKSTRSEVPKSDTGVILMVQGLISGHVYKELVDV